MESGQSSAPTLLTMTWYHNGNLNSELLQGSEYNMGTGVTAGVPGPTSTWETGTIGSVSVSASLYSMVSGSFSISEVSSVLWQLPLSINWWGRWGYGNTQALSNVPICNRWKCEFSCVKILFNKFLKRRRTCGRIGNADCHQSGSKNNQESYREIVLLVKPSLELNTFVIINFSHRPRDSPKKNSDAIDTFADVLTRLWHIWICHQAQEACLLLHCRHRRHCYCVTAPCLSDQQQWTEDIGGPRGAEVEERKNTRQEARKNRKGRKNKRRKKDFTGSTFWNIAIDCKIIAIYARIWLWICRQSLLTCFTSRLLTKTEQNLLT